MVIVTISALITLIEKLLTIWLLKALFDYNKPFFNVWIKTSFLTIRWANNSKHRAIKGQPCSPSRAWSVEPTRMEIYDVCVRRVSNLQSILFVYQAQVLPVIGYVV